MKFANTTRGFLLPLKLHKLPELLYKCVDMECSDLRDILYSLTGLDSEFGLAPDYKISTAVAYTLFARRLIERGYIYSLFFNANRSLGFQEYADIKLPSWVPDLRKYLHITGTPDPSTYKGLNFQFREDNALTFSPFEIGEVRKVKRWDKTMKVTCAEGKRSPAAHTSRFTAHALNSASSDRKLNSVVEAGLRNWRELKPAKQQHSITAELTIPYVECPRMVMPGDMLCSMESDVNEKENIVWLLRPVNEAIVSSFRLVCAFGPEEDPYIRKYMGGYIPGYLPWELERTTVHLI